MDKKIAIQQKNYTIFAILSGKTMLNKDTTIPISIPQQTLKPYKYKQSHATYISPKQLTKFNLKTKLNTSLKESQRSKVFFNQNFSIRNEKKYKFIPSLLLQNDKKAIIPQERQKKKNIRQYLHEISKKNKRMSQRIQSDSYISDIVRQKNKIKTVLIVKNMTLDKKETNNSTINNQQITIYKKHAFPIHQTHSYFFNRKKSKTQENIHQNHLGQTQRIQYRKKPKVTIEQLCNLRQQLKKCSQSEQIFQKYKRRQTQPSYRQNNHDSSIKQQIDDTINNIYNSFYKTHYDMRSKKNQNTSLFRNKQLRNTVRQQQISPWNKKISDDNQFL